MMHRLSASSEMNFPSSSFHQKKTNVPLSNSKASFRPDKMDGIELIGHHARKVAISSQLNSQESFILKKQGANPEVDHIRTLLIDNYDSYTYNIYQELSVVNGVPPVVVHNDEWTWTDAYHYLYEDRAFDNIVISPGPGSPMCSSDIGLCLRVLLECSDIPIFGVCLGHQALAYVHGAKIVHASMPVHGRLSEIQHDGCRLFHNIPSGSGLKVVRYHSLVVDGNSLPKELIPVAWTSSSSLHPFSRMSNFATGNEVNKFNPEINDVHVKDGNCLLLEYGNERAVMGIMHAQKPHFGVQFHPESVATSYGRQMFKNFRDITADFWLASNSPPVKYQNARSQVPAAGLSQRRLKDRSSTRNSVNCNCTAPKLNVPEPKIIAQNLSLRWKKLDGLATTVGGAEKIFRDLYGTYGARETFWLDSSSTEKGRARFSFMGGKGGSLWKQLTYKLSEQSDDHVQSKGGGHLSVQDAQGSVKTLYLEGGFLDYMNKELQSVHCNEKEFEGLPFEFCGGYVGYIGYNLKVECGAAYNHHDSTTPDASLFFADNFVAIDHQHGDVFIVSLHDENELPSSWLDDTEKKLLSIRGCLAERENKKKLKLAYSDVLEAGFLSEKSREEYIKDVEQCLGYITDGESYELCLTTQMRKRTNELDPLHLYLKLREQNPAPYAAWLNFSNQNLSICSSSPERFLRLDRNGILEAKPIKGTIARGSTSEKDEQLRMQLQYSEKDQAENLMIVDLLRNDLGRVCEPGSVHVPHLMEVESYATVHTMVSTIRGRKREDVGPFECVRAAFPGGSMTGAPKLRSMEILDYIESSSRGIYSGSIGYFSVNKTFDLNIVIRTVVIHNGEASIGAGGAIIALSKPEDEYDEMILKTRAPVNAIMDLQTQ